MKKDNIIYWATTGLVSAMMLFSAFNYFTNEDMKNAFIHLGFPSYFRVELGIAKILGVLALSIPMVPTKLKEAAYVGFTINLISAAIAHYSSGDGASAFMPPLVFLGILAVSYTYFQKRVNTKLLKNIE